MIGFSQFSRHWQSGGVPSRCCCLRCSGRGDRQGFKRAGPNQMTNVAGRGGAWRGVAERGRNGEGGDGDAPVVYINTGRHRAQWLASPCLAPRRVSAPPPRWHAAGTTRPGKQISEIFHGFSSRLPPAELFVLGAAPPPRPSGTPVNYLQRLASRFPARAAPHSLTHRQPANASRMVGVPLFNRRTRVATPRRAAVDVAGHAQLGASNRTPTLDS